MNATVGGEPLGPADASTFAFDDGLRASGSWKTLCLSEEVLLLMRIEEVMGLVVEGIDLTIRVRRKFILLVSPLRTWDSGRWRGWYNLLCVKGSY